MSAEQQPISVEQVSAEQQQAAAPAEGAPAAPAKGCCKGATACTKTECPTEQQAEGTQEAAADGEAN